MNAICEIFADYNKNGPSKVGDDLLETVRRGIISLK